MSRLPLRKARRKPVGCYVGGKAGGNGRRKAVLAKGFIGGKLPPAGYYQIFSRCPLRNTKKTIRDMGKPLAAQQALTQFAQTYLSIQPAQGPKPRFDAIMDSHQPMHRGASQPASSSADTPAHLRPDDLRVRLGAGALALFDDTHDSEASSIAGSPREVAPLKPGDDDFHEPPTPDPKLDGEPADATIDLVAQMENVAGASKHGPVLKKPATDADTASVTPMKRPAAAGAQSAAPKTQCTPAVEKRPAAFMLGCSRCRGSPKGCLTCRVPEYTGKRWQRGNK